MFVRGAADLGRIGTLRNLFAGLEAVSNPGFGNDVARRGGVGLEFLAELAHEDAKVFDLLGVLPAPDRRQKRAVVYNLAGAARQIDEKIELLGREADFIVTDGNLMRTGVDAEIADFDHGVKFTVGRNA